MCEVVDIWHKTLASRIEVEVRIDELVGKLTITFVVVGIPFDDIAFYSFKNINKTFHIEGNSVYKNSQISLKKSRWGLKKKYYGWKMLRIWYILLLVY